ncbi:retropepsin-like aspartic protease [Mariprofundus sp. KV]|uniref:retropepsin-like aspartic protease family protein n=1 Tax=Mariprofundus sp. KV TaxID=2608715 RepID=UPI0015A092BE|nr:retropepsin-like aspartic protease [Mariprofundus sp. KV]NWF35768.1 TIGR02281 family clan AA aspartic protease [Mariprofundus sp. KV]
MTVVLDAVMDKDYSQSMVNIGRSIFGKPPLKVAAPSCMPQSIEGSTFVFDYPALHSGNVPMVQLELSNQIRDKSILVHLNAPDDRNRRILSSLVPSMGSVTVSVPASKYNVSFDKGNYFCNLNRGFLGGSKKIGIRQLMDVETFSHATLEINDGAVANGGLAISLTETQNKMNMVSSTESGRSYLTIPMSRDGHFYVTAEGNGFPVVFLVDSGATNISFPAHYMKNLNVKKCSPVKTNTANGVARGCKSIIREIKIGPYTINNVNAYFLEKLNTPLLGMNVLSKFTSYRVDDVMQLVHKGQ